MQGLTEAITGAIGDYGLYAVFLLSLLDAVFPAASELVMVYAGALAVGAFPGSEVTLFGSQLDSSGWAFAVIASAGLLGYLLGSLLGWGIGRYGGRPTLERHGRWLHVTPAKLERVEAWFSRYGEAAVLFGRVVPVVRSFVAIPAGVAGVPPARYTLLTALGSAPWYFGLTAAGLAVGSGWEHLHESFRYADYAVVALLLACALALLVRYARRRGRAGGGYTRQA